MSALHSRSTSDGVSARPLPLVTGLVLAGGRGSRMGGVDKGLQLHAGQPLAGHALERLRPQVDALMINANRNLEAYAQMGARLGAPVLQDAWLEFPGPLAGMAAGLAHCTTPWLVTVPCDTPGFPADLVQRLAEAALAQDAQAAMAATFEPDGSLQRQPVFCLLHVSVRASLETFLQQGLRRIDRWTAQLRCATVVFEHADDFFNVNTPEELERLGAPPAVPGAPGT